MLTHTHPRGTICVERTVGLDARIEWLRIDGQQCYKEWTGCFSVL